MLAYLRSRCLEISIQPFTFVDSQQIYTSLKFITNNKIQYHLLHPKNDKLSNLIMIELFSQKGNDYIFFFLHLKNSCDFASKDVYNQQMFSSYSIANNLLLKVVFFTAKSARQTTPNLIKNPRLTERGFLKPTSKSYAYQIPANTPNAHLYWNNTEQNKLRRKQYNTHKLYKLGVVPIHDAQGQLLNNRTVNEVLYELANLRIIKKSLGRTFANLREIFERFPETLSNQNRDIVVWTLNQLDVRNLPTFSFYQFRLYCGFRESAGLAPSKALIFHCYKWIEGEVERPTGKLTPKRFLKCLRYSFDQPLTQQFNQILIKKKIQFKLFEDLQPLNKPIGQLFPKLYSQQQLKELKADPEFKLQNYAFLEKIPGGKSLYDRIEKA